jgi:Domain of unknown function (4846)
MPATRRWIGTALSVAPLLVAMLAGSASLASGQAYPWLASTAAGTVANRIEVPSGFKPVHLFNGALKSNQEAHHVVLDIDVGKRDRQQCADAVMRLRAEYLRQAGQEGDVCFRFTDGTAARWTDWKGGARPQISKRKTVWEKVAGPDASYASFRRYLDVVFSYAGTFSLARELDKVSDARHIEAGDVFIEGGFPGHVVIVVDVAEDGQGRRAVLLAQSYMPAQEIHVLRNPATPASPWYVIDGDGPLATPEWDFPAGSLRRFSATGCPKLK